MTNMLDSHWPELVRKRQRDDEEEEMCIGQGVGDTANGTLGFTEHRNVSLTDAQNHNKFI